MMMMTRMMLMMMMMKMMLLMTMIERFSLDCRKTKTKVNTLANQRT